MTAVAILAWYACGVGGFLYWWREDCEVDGVVLADSLVFGIMGPLNLLTGYIVHRLLGGRRVEAEAGWDFAGPHLHR